MSQIITYAYQLASVVLGIVVLLTPTLILPPVRNLVIERGLGTMIEAATRQSRAAKRREQDEEERRNRVREALTQLSRAVATLTTGTGIAFQRRADAEVSAKTAIHLLRMYCSEPPGLTDLEFQIMSQSIHPDSTSAVMKQIIDFTNRYCIKYDPPA